MWLSGADRLTEEFGGNINHHRGFTPWSLSNPTGPNQAQYYPPRALAPLFDYGHLHHQAAVRENSRLLPLLGLRHLSRPLFVSILPLSIPPVRPLPATPAALGETSTAFCP